MLGVRFHWSTRHRKSAPLLRHSRDLARRRGCAPDRDGRDSTRGGPMRVLAMECPRTARRHPPSHGLMVRTATVETTSLLHGEARPWRLDSAGKPTACGWTMQNRKVRTAPPRWEVSFSTGPPVDTPFGYEEASELILELVSVHFHSRQFVPQASFSMPARKPLAWAAPPLVLLPVLIGRSTNFSSPSGTGMCANEHDVGREVRRRCLTRMLIGASSPRWTDTPALGSALPCARS